MERIFAVVGEQPDATLKEILAALAKQRIHTSRLRVVGTMLVVADYAARHREIFLGGVPTRQFYASRARWLGKLQGKTTSGIGSAKGTAMKKAAIYVRAGDSEAAEAIRELIEAVIVFRDHSRPGGVTVEISGRLNALLGEQAYPNRVRGVRGKMVAEERYQQYHHGGFRRKWPTCSMWPEILT